MSPYSVGSKRHEKDMVEWVCELPSFHSNVFVSIVSSRGCRAIVVRVEGTGRVYLKYLPVVTSDSGKSDISMFLIDVRDE